MRFLKRVLTSVLVYIAVFGTAVLTANLCGVQVQDSLITAVCGSAAVELTISGVASSVLVAFNVNRLTIEQVTAIISAVSVAAVYILGESYVDGKRAGGGNAQKTI